MAARTALRRTVLAGAVLAASMPAFASEGAAETFLGLPVVLWKTANMLVFFGLLAWLLVRPLAHMFKSRQEDIARRLEEAERQRAESESLRAEMETRLERLAGEIAELQERLRREGEHERAALIAQGETEAQRLLEQVDREAKRRVEEAREQLAGEAARIAADLATELLAKEMTAEDRRRIFERALTRLQQGGVQ